MIDCDGYISLAPRRPWHERDALMRCFKGADQGAAIKEQKLAREQSAQQFAEQMGLMKQQYVDAQKVKTPTYAPASPTASNSPDAYMAGIEARRRQQRRFGSAATVLTPVLGGARPLAA